MRLRKIFVFGLFLGVSWCCAQKKEQLQTQSNLLKKQISSINEDLEKSKKKSGLSVVHLQALNKKISLREKIASNTRKEKRIIEDDIYLKQLEINRNRRELLALRENYAQVLVKAYKNTGVQNKMTFVLSSKNLGEALRRYQYLRQYTDYQKRKAKEILDKTEQIKKIIALQKKAKEDKLKLLESQKKDLQALTGERSQKKELLKDFRKNEAKLTAELKKKQVESKKLETKIRKIINEEIRIAKAEVAKKAEIEKKRKAEVAAAKERDRVALENRKKIEEAKELRERAEAEEKRLVGLLREKEREEEKAIGERKSQAKLKILSEEKGAAVEMAKKAAERLEKARASEYAVNKKTEEEKKEAEDELMRFFSTEGRAVGGDFVANKGKLPFPVSKGQVTHMFGLQPHPVFKHIKEENTGVKIAVPQGMKALCVFPGVVSSVIYSAGLRTVIVKHGDYFSIYGNLSNTHVSKNQRISPGTPIGEIGTDFEGVYTLDFQIWKGGTPVDPLTWVSH